MRLFVALDFPDAIRDLIRAQLSHLRPLARSTRWVGVEGMHVTLKFIGSVDEEKFAPIVSALARVRSRAPVEMRFKGVGFFPNERRPRVCWCGIEASANLPELAKEIEQSLLPLGIAREERPFVPHLTLARFDSPQGLHELVQKARALESPDFGATQETQFHLFESVLRRSGAQYTKLKSFAFAK